MNEISHELHKEREKYKEFYNKNTEISFYRLSLTIERKNFLETVV